MFLGMSNTCCSRKCWFRYKVFERVGYLEVDVIGLCGSVHFDVSASDEVACRCLWSLDKMWITLWMDRSRNFSLLVKKACRSRDRCV